MSVFIKCLNLDNIALLLISLVEIYMFICFFELRVFFSLNTENMSDLESLSEETILDTWTSQMRNGTEILKQPIQGKPF